MYQDPPAFVGPIQYDNSDIAQLVETSVERLRDHHIDTLPLPTDAPSDEKPKKTAIYHHPLVRQVQEFYARSNEKRIAKLVEEGRLHVAEAQTRNLHDFDSEVLAFIPMISELLIEKINETKVIKIDTDTLARQLKAIIDNNAPRAEEYQDVSANHEEALNAFKRAETGYIMAADLLATEIGAALSGQPLEGENADSLTAMAGDFKRRLNQGEDIGPLESPSSVLGGDIAAALSGSPSTHLR